MKSVVDNPGNSRELKKGYLRTRLTLNYTSKPLYRPCGYLSITMRSTASPLWTCGAATLACALVWYEIEGKTHDEAARRLHLPRNLTPDRHWGRVNNGDHVAIPLCAIMVAIMSKQRCLDITP